MTDPIREQALALGVCPELLAKVSIVPEPPVTPVQEAEALLVLAAQDRRMSEGA